jgi:hypothetical protein
MRAGKTAHRLEQCLVHRDERVQDLDNLDRRVVREGNAWPAVRPLSRVSRQSTGRVRKRRAHKTVLNHGADTLSDRKKGLPDLLHGVRSASRAGRRDEEALAGP